MTKSTKDILISIAVTIGTLGLCYFFFKKKDDSSEVNYIPDNKIDELGNVIISIPETKLESYPIIYVFGGIDYATPKWMLSQVPKEILYKSIVVFIPYTVSYDVAKHDVSKYLSGKGYKTNSVSIIGFSAGGTNVQKVYNNNFKFIGLIDPSTSTPYLSLPFKPNTSMVYNDANWGGYPAIKSALPKLDSKISLAGGDSEKVSLRHVDIPKYFFEKYKNQIV